MNLLKGKGTQFDPKLVDAFVEIIKDSIENKNVVINKLLYNGI